MRRWDYFRKRETEDFGWAGLYLQVTHMNHVLKPRPDVCTMLRGSPELACRPREVLLLLTRPLFTIMRLLRCDALGFYGPLIAGFL